MGRADASWKAYMAEEINHLPCHLMPYPFQVSRDGTMDSLPGCENFPDTHAPVLGKEIGSMPDTLTT